MTIWCFTGYYRTPRERAQRWNWRCTEEGVTKIASLRMFANFADCLADAREHGYVQHRHLARFDRRYECQVLAPAGERRTVVPPRNQPDSDRREQP
ncbi:MAG: hypothetical protein ACM3SS_03680 [Rhodospirillaceae bacterium]